MNAGIYVLNPLILKFVDETLLGYATTIGKNNSMQGKANMFPVHENWIDIGQIEEYNKANENLK